ncbi:hypothetical protein ACQ4LE_008521 [Meloidogyne hapla]
MATIEGIVDLSAIDNPIQKEILADFDRRRKARSLTLPTDDIKVKLMLRKCNEPICIFGEDILDRRERLRSLLSRMSEDEIHAILHLDDKERADIQDDQSTWYHRGPAALRDARVEIADFSLERAKQRLERARVQAMLSQQERALIKQATHRRIQTLQIYGTQVSGIRPTSFAEFSPDSKHIITSNWSGQVSVWSIPDCVEELKLQGHPCQVGAARFHPGAYKTQDPLLLNAASCDHSGNVLLWNLVNGEKPLAKLERHEDRVPRLAFHQNGRHLCTTCFDSSWRLFDLETLQELIYQEGHSKSLFDLDFHVDGSLLLTGGLDCYGRVWDLRTGRCIMFLEGHQKGIYTATWHQNGFLMVTGSADNTCKIWDVRMRRQIYTMSAHNNLVSRVRIDPSGEYLVTGSYDNTMKLWTCSGWQPLRIFDSHNMKVTCVDISPDENWIASCCYDRTFKLWNFSREN